MKLCLQGAFEGTCFPYSIANAYLILKGKRPSSKYWDAAVKRMPFNEEFVTSRGTELYDDDLEMYRSAVDRFLNDYAFKKKIFHVSIVSSIKTLDHIDAHIDERSVVLVNDRSQHWLCAVDVDNSGKNLLLACSDQINRLEEKYCEKTSLRFGRVFNFEKSVSNLDWLHLGIGIKISLNRA